MPRLKVRIFSVYAGATVRLRICLSVWRICLDTPELDQRAEVRDTGDASEARERNGKTRERRAPMDLVGEHELEALDAYDGHDEAQPLLIVTEVVDQGFVGDQAAGHQYEDRNAPALFDGSAETFA